MKWIAKNPKKTPNKNDSIEEQIASIRGIKDVNRFLSPTDNELFDPYLIKNIEEASNRILKAIHNDERVVISYDADADGITSCTIMIRYLMNYMNNVDYIFGERNDGHGIAEQVKIKGLDKERYAERIERSKTNLEKIKNCDLLILIDSSSNDVKTCRDIVETFGCDIVILDHHEIEAENPHVILVNPQQDGCQYPNKHLSGAGVVFKTIQVIEDNLGQVDVWQYIDLVAVGMYADMMRVDELENRYLIMHGLRNIKNVGLLRILKGAKADLFKLNGDSIGFSIAPMINGVARLDNIKLAIDIFLTDDDDVAKKLRLQMQKVNEKRKVMQKEITDRYMLNVDDTKKVLIVSDDESSKGFNGLVCQQLTGIYRRPVIVGRLHNGVLNGSFRSYNGFNIKEFLSNSGLVEESLGHNFAGGVSIKEENLEELINYIEENIPNLEEKEPTVIYDIEIDASEVREYITASEKFNLIAGNGFHKVVIKVNNITVEESVCIGKTEETVKIKTFDELELIRFKVNKDYASELGYFDVIEAVGQLSMNEFYNFGLKQKISTPQIIINDFRVVE